MEVTIKLNKGAIELLEKWRNERLSNTLETIDKTENELVKRALISSYETVKNADYEFLAQSYFNFQAIEEEYKYM